MGIWKGDVLVSDLEELENDGRIGNLLEKTQCKRGDISQKDNFFSNHRWTNQNPWRRSGTENIHLDTAPTQFKQKVTLIFLENQKGLFPPPLDSFPDAGESINDFWSMSGNFIYRHHVESSVKLWSSREESFPIPLKYIDVSRTNCTNLDVKQEKTHRRLLECRWVERLVRSLDRFHIQFTLLEEKPPDGFLWFGRRLTRKQLTSTPPDHLWPELWKKMGKNVKLKGEAKVVE